MLWEEETSGDEVDIDSLIDDVEEALADEMAEVTESKKKKLKKSKLQQVSIKNLKMRAKAQRKSQTLKIQRNWNLMIPSRKMTQ